MWFVVVQLKSETFVGTFNSNRPVIIRSVLFVIPPLRSFFPPRPLSRGFHQHSVDCTFPANPHCPPFIVYKATSTSSDYSSSSEIGF